MRSRSRLITRDLKVEDFKCDLFVDEKLICDDCGVEMRYALQVVGKRAFCKECAPWYKEQAELDRVAIEQDFNRVKVMHINELKYNDWDYWD